MKTPSCSSASWPPEAYRQAFEKLVDVVRQLHKPGVFIVFGTDTGGSFSYHRELELYQSAGMTAPEILKRACAADDKCLWSAPSKSGIGNTSKTLSGLAMKTLLVGIAALGVVGLVDANPLVIEESSRIAPIYAET